MPNPFGIELGSTPDASSADYRASFKRIPRPHPDLKEYHGVWRPGFGLVVINASSAVRTDDPYARATRATYDKIAQQLEKAYGAPAVCEDLDEDSIYTEERYFCSSLNNGERLHFRFWETGRNTIFDANIGSILLKIESRDMDTSWITLTYSLKGGDVSETDSGFDAL